MTGTALCALPRRTTALLCSWCCCPRGAHGVCWGRVADNTQNKPELLLFFTPKTASFNLFSEPRLGTPLPKHQGTARSHHTTPQHPPLAHPCLGAVLGPEDTDITYFKSVAPTHRFKPSPRPPPVFLGGCALPGGLGSPLVSLSRSCQLLLCCATPWLCFCFFLLAFPPNLLHKLGWGLLVQGKEAVGRELLLPPAPAAWEH